MIDRLHQILPAPEARAHLGGRCQTLRRGATWGERATAARWCAAFCDSVDSSRGVPNTSSGVSAHDINRMHLKRRLEAAYDINMPTDSDDRTAARVLNERLRSLQPEVWDAVRRSLESHRALLELMAKEDALRQAASLIMGEPLEPESGSADRLARLRGRLESLVHDLRVIEHAARRGEDRRAPSAVLGPRLHAEPSTPHPPASAPNLSASGAGARRPSRTGSALSIEADAVEVARRQGGLVRVRELVDRVMQRDIGRFSNNRSAYASVFAQLERSARFMKADRGEFFLVTDEPTHPESAGGSDAHEGGGQ